MENIALFGLGFWGFATVFNKALLKVFFPKNPLLHFKPVIHPELK